jgi:hypothetical protein
MNTNTTQLLNMLFNDPKTGFVGAEKLLKRAKLFNPMITLKQGKDFLAQNPIHQVFQKPVRNNQIPCMHGNWSLSSRFDISYAIQETKL